MAGRRVFDHVLIVMLENQYRDYVLQNDFFKTLASKGVELTAGHGVMHPSQTNYIASIAGELCDVTYDTAPPPLPQQTIVDLVEAAGLTWKAYMDAYTPVPWSADLVPADQGTYVIKHDPFSSFANIRSSADRWSKIVDGRQLWVDVANGDLPEFAWFTPDLWNDGHYPRGHFKEQGERAPQLVDQTAEWLEWFLGTLRFPGPDSLLPARTLVVVTYDESDFEAAWEAERKSTYDGPNQIYTVLLGDDVVEPGSAESEGYNHYGLMRTIEENFGLGTLGKNDTDSNWFRFLWGERFAWGDPQPTPIPGAGALAAAGLGSDLHVVHNLDGGALAHRVWDGEAWSAAKEIPGASSQQVALASWVHGLVAVYDAGGGQLAAITSADGATWSTAETVVDEEAAGPFALSPCDRGGGVMLAYRTMGGAIGSRRLGAAGWDAPVATGHATEGALALAALGHTLLLTFLGEDGHTMRAVTYTTAEFNTTHVEPNQWGGPFDNGVANQWSPTAFPVAHFAAVVAPQTPGEPEPALQPFATGGAMATAELDGVVHLAFSAPGGDGLRATRYSIPGVLTPATPVAYRKGDGQTTSNGFGTIAEAGWELPEALPGAFAGDVTAASTGDELMLIHATPGQDRLEMRVGSYQSW